MPPTAPDHMDEFRLPIGVVILLQTIIAFSYIIPVESDPALNAQLALRYLEPILFFTPIFTVVLHTWRPPSARWFAILAPAVTLLSLPFWLPIPGSLALLSISTGLAAGLIGPRAAGLTAVASTAALLILRAVSGYPDGWQIGIAFAAILTTLVLTVSVHRAVVNVAGWSRRYYDEALRIMEESRHARAGLQAALDDLAHANRQLALLYERQGALQRIAEEAERTKSNFVAKVSHEFRTPLNMILGLAGVMLENPRTYGRALPPALVEDLQIIQRNCDHLAALVDDVLALSQLQSGSVVLHREEVDLAAAIAGAADVVRPLLSQKKLELHLDLPPDLPPISADRTRLRQVILNLLSNAARFTETGGITVRVQVCPTGAPSASDESSPPAPREVVISVADTGAGIAPEDLARIFEPFCQGPEQVWRTKGGSGLGLTISMQFVELHDGRIWVESTLGCGSTFYVALPLQAPLAPTRSPGSWISREWPWVERVNRTGAASLLPDRPRVIFCDSTGALAPGLSSHAGEVELFPAEGISDVAQALDGAPAHAVLFAAATPADLRTTLHAAAQALPPTPLLGWVVPPRPSPARDAGADHYLVKPISLAALKDALATLPSPPRRILIADDDPEARTLLARMLHLLDSGCIVTFAASGTEALQQLATVPCDLLLLDIMMPGRNGVEVLAELRRTAATCTLPVFVVSAQDLYTMPAVCAEMLLAFNPALPLPQALACTLGVAQALLTPLAAPRPVLPKTSGAQPVCSGSAPHPVLAPVRARA